MLREESWGEEGERCQSEVYFIMYCPGGEVVGAAQSKKFIFCSVQRQLDGQKVHFIMYCLGGKVKGLGSN